MSNLKAVTDLFSADTLRRMKQYAPPEELFDREKSISGRLLEETVELHLASGGTPTSAMAHVMDAIANESFKRRKLAIRNQDAYPSNFDPSYSEVGVEEELGDTLFVWMVNMLTNQVSIDDVKKVIDAKMKKLETARMEGKLDITDKGLFYIRKD